MTATEDIQRLWPDSTPEEAQEVVEAILRYTPPTEDKGHKLDALRHAEADLPRLPDIGEWEYRRQFLAEPLEEHLAIAQVEAEGREYLTCHDDFEPDDPGEWDRYHVPPPEPGN